MQGTIVLLIALGGIGCHHKTCNPACAPKFDCSSACNRGGFAIEYSTFVEPSCYSCCYTDCKQGPSGCERLGYARDGWGPASGGYVGCFAGGAVGCGCSRFPGNEHLHSLLYH
jgi:hypothetical protein